MIGVLVNPDHWIRLAGGSEGTLPYAHDFLVIVFLGLVFSTLTMSLNGLIIAEGNARVPMTSMILGAVLNMVLEAIFIVGLGLAVKGAAIATVIAQIISFAYMGSYYFSHRNHLKIHRENLIPDFNILKDIMAIGITALALTISLSLSSIIVNRMLVTYGGDLAVSAFGIINRLIMFAIMPGIVIGQGLQPILGFNYGARRYDRVLKALKTALTASFCICLVTFAILFFMPEPFVRIFTSDNTLVSMGTHAMKHLIFFLYLVGFLMTATVSFQALGKAFQSFICSVSRPTLFLIPLLFLLGHLWQYEGVLLALPAADLLGLGMVLFFLILQVAEIRKKRDIENRTLESNLNLVQEAERAK